MSRNNPQPTYKRQRFLLAFISQLDNSVSSTDLQKLVFLHSMKYSADSYEFIPYKFGAYSFQLAEDVDILRRDGYLADEGKRIRAAGEYPQEAIFDIDVERGNSLIRKAYLEYPYYTINSEITDKIFYGVEEKERFNREKQNYCQTGRTLFTIGYEGRTIEAFINTLIINGVKLLCDVRKNPMSRKFGFSKGKLEHITGTAGIKYIHIPNLGIESDKRSALANTEDYKMLFDNYKKTLPDLEPCINWVYSLLCSNARVALMCYEREATMCHRHVIRDYITDAHRVKSVDL